jgi:hypothetical protein
MRWNEGGEHRRSGVEGDNSLDLSSPTLSIPDPDGDGHWENEESVDLNSENVPGGKIGAGAKEAFKSSQKTDRKRNIAVKISSSLPLKLIRLILGPSMIFSLIVLMVFSEEVNSSHIGVFMIIFPFICLYPSLYAAAYQKKTADNDFGPTTSRHDKLSFNSFPGAERIRTMINENYWDEMFRLSVFSIG